MFINGGLLCSAVTGNMLYFTLRYVEREYVPAEMKCEIKYLKCFLSVNF